jgi:hypothetical protein
LRSEINSKDKKRKPVSNKNLTAKTSLKKTKRAKADCSLYSFHSIIKKGK